MEVLKIANNRLLNACAIRFRETFLPRLPPRVAAALRAARFRFFASQRDREVWRQRIELVLQCPDNGHIRRVSNAGTIRQGHQVMHNGSLVLAGGYYGNPIREMLERNRGVHEPHEERIFQEVLPFLRGSGTMLELGAYWGFYSLWFHQALRGRCVLVEPDALALSVGKHNFKTNGAVGEFEQAYIGRYSDTHVDGIPIKCVDDITAERRIRHIDLLHSDIQGAELDMLNGAECLLHEKRVTYMFISTHSNDLHENCERHLRNLGFGIVASINLDDTFSEDGILVGKLRDAPGPDEIKVSRRTQQALA